MQLLFKTINKKINGLFWSLLLTGILLVLLSILVVWTDLILRLMLGFFVLIIAYVFLYGAFKVWEFKKEIMKFLSRL
jgi:hypothetical protein